MKLQINSNVSKSKWIAFIEQSRCKNQSGSVDTLEIDFSESSFIEPFYLVSLACMIEEYSVNGTIISFSLFNKLELREYLLSGYFLEFWKKDFDRYDGYFATSNSTTLRLWKIDSTRISEYVQLAQTYYETRYLQEKDATPLNISLAELFNNIIEHAASSVSGFVLNQYYPKNGKLKIAVCDLGVGIARRINDYLSEKGEVKLSDKEAIIKAFDLSFSSKSIPQNRGWGLTTLKNIVLSCNGTLRLIANSYCLSFNKNGKGEFGGFELKNEFCGTLFEIILDTNAFDTRSEDEFDLDF